MFKTSSKGWIGSKVVRKEGPAKLTGRARYVDDITMPGMIHGVTVRSSVARGRIKNIKFTGNLPWNEIVVVSARDIPGDNHVALILKDQPFLADGVIHHPDEPILLLAHSDKHLLEEARRHVEIEVEELPAVFSIEDSIDCKTLIWGQDNVFKSYLVQKGNVEHVWDHAYKVFEAEYSTGAQEQLYIENNGMIAVASPKDGVTVWGSMQCPYYIHKALLPLFKLPEDQIRVVQTETGGGFGGKEEYPSMLAGHAALLAWKSGKPVKMIYDRSEDMTATTKRHPSRTRHKTAVDRDGRLLAMEIDFVIDGGAYATLSAVVLSRGTIHSAGPYLCDNVRVRARAVATNTPPHGAFRGFGAPQSIFALERHMDYIAREMGLEPDELRRRNFLQDGLATATGQIVRDGVDLNTLLDRAFRETDYFRKRKELDAFNETSRFIKRGIGFATFMHGSGFTGSGEKYLASVVGAEFTSEGRVRVLAASTEIGQGTNTVFSQISADALGLLIEDIEVAQPDTRNVPNSGPTVASRTCMIVGKLVERASLGLKALLVQSGHIKDNCTRDEFVAGGKRYLKEVGPLKHYSQYIQPPNVSWDDEKYQGDAYAAFAWAVYLAEVSVDLRTFETRVDDFTAVQEVGRVVHPTLAAGQIEGGVAQGIGYALYEKVVYNKGRVMNGQMTNYIMPTSVDLGKIHVVFDEVPYENGPGGAKGIGELPMDGPGPAILNAMEHALGVEKGEKPLLTRIPLLPEDLSLALHVRKKSQEVLAHV